MIPWGKAPLADRAIIRINAACATVSVRGGVKEGRLGRITGGGSADGGGRPASRLVSASIAYVRREVDFRSRGESRPNAWEAWRLAARKLEGEGRGESHTPSCSQMRLSIFSCWQRKVTNCLSQMVSTCSKIWNGRLVGVRESRVRFPNRCSIAVST